MFSAQAPSLLQRLSGDFATQTPLVEEFAGIPVLKGKGAAPSDVVVSKLSNGLQTASIDFGGSVASIGLFVKAGSRYESVPGTAALLEYMAYASTQKRSAAKLQKDIEDTGAAMSARASRETFVYSADCLRSNTGEVLEALAEAVTQPRLSEWEVNERKADLVHLIEENGADARSTVLDGCTRRRSAPPAASATRWRHPRRTSRMSMQRVCDPSSRAASLR